MLVLERKKLCNAGTLGGGARAAAAKDASACVIRMLLAVTVGFSGVSYATVVSAACAHTSGANASSSACVSVMGASISCLATVVN